MGEADRHAGWTALETVARVQQGSIRVRDVVESALGRIAADRLNAFEQILAHAALTAADELDARDLRDLPLAGVPVAVKAEDDIAGVVTTYGGISRTTPATEDCSMVARLKAAGAVVVATTTMPEFGQFPFTEGTSWGVTRNPYDPSRSVGGSSGGSAVAVATGCVPMATAGDGGGSIRIPASACGVVGLKAMRGRVSTAPHADLWGGLGVVGVLTRTVTDTAVAYDVIAGSTPVDRWSAPAWSSSCAQVVAADAEPMTIGLVTQPAPGSGRTSREVVSAIERLARTLEGLGHRVEQLPRWPVTAWTFLPQFLAAMRGELALAEDRRAVERRTAQTARWGRLISRSALARAERQGNALGQRYANVDVVLSPTMACLPPRVGQLDAVGSFRGVIRSIPMTAFTQLANVTGAPALSIPAGWSQSGLPIGAQLMTFRHDEQVLVALAAQCERSR